MYHVLAHPDSAFLSDNAHWASSDTAFPRCSPTPPSLNCHRRHYHTPIQKCVTMWHHCALPLRHNLGCTRLRPLIFCIPPCHLRQACQPGSWGTYSRRLPLVCCWLLGPQPIASSIHAPARWQRCLGAPRRNGSACTQPKCSPPPARSVMNNSASRFGSVRSLGDRDQHALAPSQLSLSEVGSIASSWHSASVSCATTHLQATSHD
jgi:hypothetical protein